MERLRTEVTRRRRGPWQKRRGSWQKPPAKQEEDSLWCHRFWLPIPTLTLVCWVTLGKSPPLSRPCNM